MTKLITTSVIRGNQQGRNRGGVYLVDLEAKTVVRAIDAQRPDIDRPGRGGERGLRGIAIDGETIYIASPDELFAFSPDFSLIDCWRSPYLRDCHGIHIYQRTLFLASAGCDTIFAFDLDEKAFHWALQVRREDFQFTGSVYDPSQGDGPIMLNKLGLNSVFASEHGLYVTGLRSGGMLHFNGKHINMAVELPPGTHDARPFRDGVLFNDSEAGALRYAGRGSGREDRAMRVPVFEDEQLQNIDAGDGEPDSGALVRQGFARGLCALSDTVVAAGSSPSTISVYDLAANRSLLSVTLSLDVRNAIHGIEAWPFD